MTSDHQRHNREFWDADADDYQAVHGGDLSARALAWGAWRIPEAELGVLGDVGGLDVLELGCGAGQWSIALAARTARSVGLDQSIGQLKHAVANRNARASPSRSSPRAAKRCPSETRRSTSSSVITAL